ncbi:MAG: peptidyl-tRNA hydrolase Pth2 [Candidatus Kariarchaeaceae archaeon]
MKQVIVLRSDLKMGKGKACAQASHAAVSASEKARQNRPLWFSQWIRGGQTKIVVKVTSSEEMINLKEKAEKAGLPIALINDAGRTQLEPGTMTALGIGPAPEDLVEPVTGKLKLM